MLKLQIISDTHLEFRGNPNFFKPRAPILCLLGDICACGTPDDFKVFIKFLKVIAPKFKKIIHVAGNHEYYAGGVHGKKLENTYEGINAKLRSLKKFFPNYIFMTNNVHKIKVGRSIVYIIGTTLWSYIPPNKKKITSSLMNDYKMLFRTHGNQSRRWNVDDTIKFHTNAVNLIKRTKKLAKKTGAKCILLTHHKPVMDGPKTITQFCYESDLAYLIKPPLILTAHGHTHKKYIQKINNITTVSNPRGYPGEKTSFDPNFCVEISL